EAGIGARRCDEQCLAELRSRHRGEKAAAQRSAIRGKRGFELVRVAHRARRFEVFAPRNQLLEWQAWCAEREVARWNECELRHLHRLHERASCELQILVQAPGASLSITALVRRCE